MNAPTTRRSPLHVGILLTLLAVDQVTKEIVVRWLGPDAMSHRFELAGRYLAFEYVENRGAAFGILDGRVGLLVILAAAVGVVFYLTFRRDAAHSAPIRVALTLIAAGAAGNLVDRVRLGYVVDFLAVGVWPKFNVADSCITVAVAILAWQALVAPDSHTPEERGQTPDDRAQNDRA